jgi:hypothetical protein
LPASYTLQGEVKVTDKLPWTCAGFGEIWRGTWGSEKVAVKVIKITGAADPDKLKKVCAVTQVLTRNLRRQADHCSAIVQGGHHLEAIKAPKPIASIWCFYQHQTCRF